jgi:hypothetical protein
MTRSVGGMPAELIEDSVDDFGNRRIVFDLGDGNQHTLIVPIAAPGTAIPSGFEFLAMPVKPGTAAAPGFILWVPFEGEPQFTWLGYTSVEEIRARWVEDLNQKPELADVMSRLLEVLAGDADEDDDTDEPD